jgi:hypothetical protein
MQEAAYEFPRTRLLPRTRVNKAAALSACSKRGLGCLAHPSPPGLEQLALLALSDSPCPTW